jgi:large subunit ribosomal protein L22
MKAALRRIRISPQKANLVAGMVRGKKVNEALALLKFMPKKGADIIYKVVHSAAYNAKNNFKQNIDDLFITKLLVTKGPTYKRSIPISRGRAHPILKRTCHIIVEVGVMERVKTKESKTKETKDKETVKKTTSKKTVVKKAEEKAKKPIAKKTTVKKTEKKTEKKKK